MAYFSAVHKEYFVEIIIKQMVLIVVSNFFMKLVAANN